ncbi:MAG: hypothetical protein ABIG44_13025 [Planctomycetota bacterium]
MRISMTRWWWSGWLIVGLVLCVSTGCALNDNPAFHRHTPVNRDPTLLEHAEHAVDQLSRSLDNLDAQMEHRIY